MATYNYQPYDPLRGNIASLTLPGGPMSGSSGADRYYSGPFTTGGANQWFDPQGNRLFLANADLEGGNPTFGYLDDWQNNPNAYADLRTAASQGDFSDPNQYWGNTPSSNFGGGLANIATGGLLGGMAGGALGSEALGSGITGNQANYGQAAGVDITGLAAGAGIAGAGVPGLPPGVDPEAAAWGAGLEGTPEYTSMLNNVGLGAEGAYGSPLYNPDPFSNLTPADLGQETLPWTTNPSVEDLGGNINPATGFPFPTGPGGTNVFPNPLGGNGQGGSGSGGYDWAGAALAAAPILAGINYAKNQGPFDTSRFEDLYSRYKPEAMTGQYDLNTALERGALSNSLAARGLSGSTFGNEAITNYGTARDIGRSELLSRAALSAGQLADPILQAQIKERALRNDLYGRGLYALGNVFGGRGGSGGSGGGGVGGGGGGGGATLTDQLRSGYNTVRNWLNF